MIGPVGAVGGIQRRVDLHIDLVAAEDHVVIAPVPVGGADRAVIAAGQVAGVHVSVTAAPDDLGPVAGGAHAGQGLALAYGAQDAIAGAGAGTHVQQGGGIAGIGAGGAAAAAAAADISGLQVLAEHIGAAIAPGDLGPVAAGADAGDLIAPVQAAHDAIAGAGAGTDVYAGGGVHGRRIAGDHHGAVHAGKILGGYPSVRPVGGGDLEPLAVLADAGDDVALFQHGDDPVVGAGAGAHVQGAGGDLIAVAAAGGHDYAAAAGVGGAQVGAAHVAQSVAGQLDLGPAVADGAGNGHLFAPAQIAQHGIAGAGAGADVDSVCGIGRAGAGTEGGVCQGDPRHPQAHDQGKNQCQDPIGFLVHGISLPLCEPCFEGKPPSTRSIVSCFPKKIVYKVLIIRVLQEFFLATLFLFVVL